MQKTLCESITVENKNLRPQAIFWMVERVFLCVRKVSRVRKVLRVRDKVLKNVGSWQGSVPHRRRRLCVSCRISRYTRPSLLATSSHISSHSRYHKDIVFDFDAVLTASSSLGADGFVPVQCDEPPQTRNLSGLVAEKSLGFSAVALVFTSSDAGSDVVMSSGWQLAWTWLFGCLM